MDAEQLHFAKILTQGRPLMWRDFLMQMLAGRFGALVLEQGRELHSLAERDDVSDALDLIGQAEGDILVRGPVIWEVRSPGLAGTILTSTGPGSTPEWQAGGGLGARTVTVHNIPASVSNAANASTGVYFESAIAMKLSYFWSYFNRVDGATYKISVWKVVGVTLTEKLGESPVYVAPAGGVANTVFELTSEAIINDGDEIAIFLTRTDDLPGTPTFIVKSSAKPTVPPCLSEPWLIRYSSVDPQISDTFIKDQTGVNYSINFIYQV